MANLLLSDFLGDVYVPTRLGISLGSIEQIAVSVRVVERWLGRRARVADLSAPLIQGFLAWYLTQAAASTVNSKRRALLQLWRCAYEESHTDTSPDHLRRKIRAVRQPAPQPVAWTPEQVAQLVAACRELPGRLRGTRIHRADWWASLILTLYWTGSRISATLAVRPTDLELSDLDNATIALRADASKTGHAQTIRLHRQAAEAVATHYDAQRQLVWPWPFGTRRLWPCFKQILRSAGLPHDRQSMFHRLRRTCYTLATVHGSREVAAAQLGHRTDMSKHYLDVRMIRTTEAADVLPVV